MILSTPKPLYSSVAACPGLTLVVITIRQQEAVQRQGDGVPVLQLVVLRPQLVRHVAHLLVRHEHPAQAAPVPY